jgi:hypothetical protein
MITLLFLGFYNLQHKLCGISHIVIAMIDLPLLAEGNLTFWRAEVDPSEIQTGESLVTGRKFIHKRAYRLVTWVDRITGVISAEGKPDSHDPTRNRTTHPAGACHTTAEAGGDTGDNFRLNVQMLGNRQQDTFSSVIAGSVE